MGAIFTYLILRYFSLTFFLPLRPTLMFCLSRGVERNRMVQDVFMRARSTSIQILHSTKSMETTNHLRLIINILWISFRIPWCVILKRRFQHRLEWYRILTQFFPFQSHWNTYALLYSQRAESDGWRWSFPTIYCSNEIKTTVERYADGRGNWIQQWLNELWKYRISIYPLFILSSTPQR